MDTPEKHLANRASFSPEGKNNKEIYSGKKEEELNQ